MTEGMSERDRRDLAFAHRDEVIEGKSEPVGPRRLGQMVSLRLEPDLAAAIRNLADSRGVSLSELLREAAALLLSQEQLTATSYVTYYEVKVKSSERSSKLGDFITGSVLRRPQLA